MQLIRDKHQMMRPLGLGAVAAIPVLAAELFELVVQVFHWCNRYLVSVYDHPAAEANWTRKHLRVVFNNAQGLRNGPGTPLPSDLNRPGLRPHGFFPDG